MTLRELTEHWRLLQKLHESRETLRSLQESIAPAGQVLTGMPHAPGVKDKVGDLAIEILEMESDIAKLQQAVKAEEQRITEFISTIDDGCTKLIFRLRFVRGLTWKEVAGLMGGWNTEESVKSTCYRYMKLPRSVSR